MNDCNVCPVVGCLSVRCSINGYFRSPRSRYTCAAPRCVSFSPGPIPGFTSAISLSFLYSDFTARRLKSRLQRYRGSWKQRCMVSNCDLTSAMLVRLNHLNIAEPAPLPSSRALSRQAVKLRSMSPMREPMPVFVMYLVM